MVAAVMAQLLQSPPNQQLKEIDYACLRQPPYAYGGLPPGWPAAQQHAHHHPRGAAQVLPPGYGGHPNPNPNPNPNPSPNSPAPAPRPP